MGSGEFLLEVPSLGVGAIFDLMLFVFIFSSSEGLVLCLGIIVISIYLTSLLFCVGSGNLFKFWYDYVTVLIVIVALPCFESYICCAGWRADDKLSEVL